MTDRTYALEDLYKDQEPDLVADVIPFVLVWLEKGSVIEVSRSASASKHEKLVLRWNEAAIERRSRGTLARARRVRTGKTADRERVAEMAAYGLAFVAISVWMPGRRAVTFREGSPPDILFDDTDLALRGVEVAGRSTGGLGALRIVLDGTKENPGGKRAQLRRRRDVAEAHLSLWCARPRVSLLLQVKP
jgi:hypothetical protein